MRSLVLALTLAVALVVLPLQSQAQAAAELVVWPSQFSFGTPMGAMTWNTTAFGLRYGSNLLPHFGFGTDIYYGSVSNLVLAGSPLTGFTGQTIAGDVSLRFGTSLGLLDLAAYGGYEALALNATGPGAFDRIVLATSGVRVGAEAKLAFSPRVALKGSVTTLTGLNSTANLVVTSPPIAAQFNGTGGSGTEYEVVLSANFIPSTSAFVGYRSGTYQTNWTGAASTPTTFSGWVFGLEARF